MNEEQSKLVSDEIREAIKELTKKLDEIELNHGVHTAIRSEIWMTYRNENNRKITSVFQI